MSSADRSVVCFSARGITKDFAVRVLHDIDLELARGQIHALLGANGAGKSTLCRIIAGLLPATQGSMVLDGQAYRPGNKATAEKRGVQIVQQELTLLGNLTVAESLLLNRLPARLGFIRRRELWTRARAALDRFGLQNIRPEDRIEELGIGQLQLLEIASALDRDCRLLILDEPTAMLSVSESERLFSKLRELRMAGIAILYISHRLQEVKELADRVTILQDGRHITTASATELTIDDMVRKMTQPTRIADPSMQSPPTANRSPVQMSVYGHDAARVPRGEDDCPGPILRVERLSRKPRVEEVSFELRPGEILGISGLVGAGRSELLRAMFGADVATSGYVWLAAPDRPEELRRHRFCHPSQAVAQGLAMLTEDRKQQGLMLPQSIVTNITLASVRRLADWPGRLNPTREQTASQELVEQLDIRCQSIDQSVGTLSGGNQQKVVMAKWLLRGARVYLLDEPTRGVDMASRQMIYRRLLQLSEQGAAIIVASSDLEELMQICDRIGVMSNGRYVAQFARHEFDAESLTRAAFQGFLQSPVGGGANV